MSSKYSVQVGSLKLGGGAPVLIQSMTNTNTGDIPSTLSQIKELADAGCDIVRVSVYDTDSARAVRSLVDNSPVPLVADVHFDYRLAVMAVENGIAKLRINPGNIRDVEKVRIVTDCAKTHHVPIRIGVNAGSLEKDILEREGYVTSGGMVESAQRHVKILEDSGFYDIVLSLKASDVKLTVETYKLAAKTFDYPLHIGVTEAGLLKMGTVKSAIGIGSLLLDGIGDTIRVSLTGSPLTEPAAALDILHALGMRGGVQLISCPTCGRTQIDVEGIASALEKELKDVKKTLRIAVMGCIVNGPGEAKEADIALCGGKDCGALYIKGKFIKRVSDKYVPEILNAVREYTDEL